MKANLLIIRDTFNTNETLGKLYLNGEFMAHTLERAWADNRKNISCIPRGVYDVRVRTASESATRDYVHLLVKKVPGRSYILFHYGNTKKDTRGCILTGLMRRKSNDGISYSRKAHTALLERILRDNLAQEIELVIKNR